MDMPKRLSVLWKKLPVVDTINPQSDKYVMAVKMKATGDSKLNFSIPG